MVPLQRAAWMVAAASLWTAWVGAQPRNLCSQVPGIARSLTRISGMPLRRPVPCAFIAKDKINAFLKQRVRDGETPQEIRAEEMVLKKFGFVPPDFDLAGSTVDLLTEQAAAFYDYDRKKLFIAETTPSESEEAVLAHELAHALADQSYHLARYIRQGRKSDDGSTARLAVMEGQATWIMSEYLARRNGRSLRDSPESVALLAGGDSGADAQYPVFGSAPLYLRRSLLFPYTQGMLFQDAVLRRDGQEAFAEVFLRAPVSTSQILHPDKYFAHVAPTDPELPHPRLPAAYKGLVGGSLGEFEHGILIEQFAGKSAAGDIAPHWRGCSFQLRENRKARRIVLLYAVEWDSQETARRYFAVYRQALRKKWKAFAVTSETADSVDGAGDDGAFELRRVGATVTSVEGLPPAAN